MGPRCSQCGERWADPACGPTHALIAMEREAVWSVQVVVTRKWNDDTTSWTGFAGPSTDQPNPFSGDVIAPMELVQRAAERALCFVPPPTGA